MGEFHQINSEWPPKGFIAVVGRIIETGWFQEMAFF